MKYLSISKIFIAPLILMMALVATACSSDEPGDKPSGKPSRTVIVYMAANNNLGTRGYDRMDLEEMRAAATAGAIPEGSHLVVYHAGRQRSPELKEITATGDVSLKTYDGGYKSGLTLTPERMKEVFADVEQLAPADSYALVFWSHGTGWVETPDSRAASGIDSRTGIRPLSFGDDSGIEMKVTSLAAGLEGRKFDFIYFDCCLMGSVEVMYELRNATPTIVASPTELQVYGMRYDRNVPVFFKEKPDMAEAARNTFDYYTNNTDGISAACTMVVVDTEALKGLADATRAIMATGALPDGSYRPIRFYSSYANAHVDMADYITALPGVDSQLIAAWRAAYDKAVTYKAATPTYGRYDLDGFGGLSCAMLSGPSDVSYMGYDNQAWWADVVSHNPALTATAD